MKHIVKLIISAFLIIPIVLFGSSKGRKFYAYKKPLVAQMAITDDDVIIPSEDYLVELYHATPYIIGLISNANFGILPTGETSDIIMSSAPLADFTVKISNQQFVFKKKESVFYQGPQLFDLLGKVHDLSITAKGKTEYYKFYIPESISAERLITNPNTGNIQRHGNILRWNPDSQYPTKVLFEYTLFDNTYPFDGDMLDKKTMIIDDYGELDLDQFFVYQDVKSILFSLSRINAIEVKTDKRIALAFTMVDHHYYSIEN